MRDLAVQGSNDTNNTASRAAIKGEGDSLGKELDRLTQSTQFNGIDLLKGAAGNSGASLNIQVGTGGSANDKIAVNLGDVATAVGTGATGLSGAAGAAGFKVDTSANAQLTIAAVDTAIAAVSAQ